MSYQVLGITKIADSEPQEFTLFLKDAENTQRGYMWRTECGTEEAVRETLTLGGINAPEIDRLILSAK
jgi:hypothetical protein